MIHPHPTVIGVDPGPVPGLVVLNGNRREVAQCSIGIAVGVVAHLIDEGGPGTLLTVEAFVVSTRAARSSSPADGTTTRNLIGALDQLAAERGVRFVSRRATDVMPWATDKRLDAAGLLTATAGMRHARAAARHALFAASHDAGLPDPLSRRARPARSPSREVRNT